MIGLLTDRINNKLEKGNLINEHARNRKPVPLNKHKLSSGPVMRALFCLQAMNMKIVPNLLDMVPNITSNISIWQADFKVPGLPLHIVEEAVIKATGTNILSTWAKLI